MKKLAVAFLLILLVSACAETPDGTIVLNEETVENFFEGGALKSWAPPSELNLVMDQPVTSAEIPPVTSGMVRLYGTLDSFGPYTTTAVPQATFPGAAQRGSTFKNSVYGMLGPAGSGGNAWFYVDIEQNTGQIGNARAYMYGFNGGGATCARVLAAAGDMLARTALLWTLLAIAPSPPNQAPRRPMRL